MIEIDFRNVDFLEDEFPSISKIKKDLKLYEYNKIFNHLLTRSRI